MFDLPPDVPRLQTLARQLRIWLGHVEQALAVAEQAQLEQRRQERSAELARPPVGEWILSSPRSRPGSPGWLHAGNCWENRPGMVPLLRDQALRLLADGAARACPSCRPDRELGVLE
ncbi:DUF6233 domain-containing protein [Streptomyces sp. 8L]|uniref:DUF6233 domain-containing protein n=1 Tax=Streptomyces sp. 8L TaxID=2877242 RepID=UPI001CD3E5AA|nr:DUF6233 domain-containing protein [Streptomyces sp. 8L]MCA1217382.1 DUF6233 domain-containing protein [Streptomyces sp. 8L]